MMMMRVTSYLESLSNCTNTTLGHDSLPPLVPRAAGDGNDDDHANSSISTSPMMITMTIPGVRHERGSGDDALERLLEAGPVLVLLVHRLGQLGMADVGLAGRQQHHRVLLEAGSGRCHCVPLHGVLQLVLQLARLGHQLRCRAAETGHAVHQLGLEEGGTFIDCFQQALV